MTAKAQLLAAARLEGSAGVRRLQENGGPKQILVVRRTVSPDLLQHRLTDNNYHSVEIMSSTPQSITLSAPTGYDLEAILTQVFGLKIVR